MPAASTPATAPRQPLTMLLSAWWERMLRLALRSRSRLYSERATPSAGRHVQLERLNQPRWSGRQRRIGLTGGIASGKSSVGRLLAARGLPVLDADTYAREALAAGSPGAEAVLARYGEQVQGAAAGGIDRTALGRIVFADGAERGWLEALIHPLVQARFAAELERLVDAPVVVLMIPLLFEAGLETLCSEVWLVDCDEHQQLQRLIERDRLSEADARARITAQWPLARKRPLVDVLIDNRGATSMLEQQVSQQLEAERQTSR